MLFVKVSLGALVVIAIGVYAAPVSAFAVTSEAKPDADGYPSTDDFRGVYEYVNDPAHQIEYNLVNYTQGLSYIYMEKPLGDWKSANVPLKMNCAEFVTYAYMYWLRTKLSYDLPYMPVTEDLRTDFLHYISAFGWWEWATQKHTDELWDSLRYTSQSTALSEIKADMDNGTIPVGSLVVFSAKDGTDEYEHIGIYVGTKDENGTETGKHYVLHCTGALGAEGRSGVLWESIDAITSKLGGAIYPHYVARRTTVTTDPTPSPTPGTDPEAHLIVDYNINGAAATTDTGDAMTSTYTVDCGAHYVGDTVTVELVVNGVPLPPNATLTPLSSPFYIAAQQFPC